MDQGGCICSLSRTKGQRSTTRKTVWRLFSPENTRHDANRRFVNKVIPIIAYQSFLPHTIFKKKTIHPLFPALLSSSSQWRLNSTASLLGLFGVGDSNSSGPSPGMKIWAASSFAQVVCEVRIPREAQIGRETLKGWA